MNVQEAIAAVKANPPHVGSPLPVLAAEVERLQATLDAARVAVGALPQNAVLCACAEFWPGQGHPDDCPTTQLTNAIDKARRALGLEV